MPLLRNFLVLLRDTRGATAVEYGFLLALIVLAMMAALTAVGGTTSSMWNKVSDKVQTASG
jgi:pilus assembly protein Flp/PilA